MALQLTSPAFADGAAIPEVYTCDGQNISPPLLWRDAPAATRSFALIADDPDAPVGTWVHWVIYNIPASQIGLQEKIALHSTLENGTLQGLNSWSNIGYGGPCPPRGTHRYFFKLYALDTVLKLRVEDSKDALLLAMNGHILAQAQLMGTYQRR